MSCSGNSKMISCGTGTGVPNARGFRAMGWRLSCRCQRPSVGRFAFLDLTIQLVRPSGWTDHSKSGKNRSLGFS